MKQYRTLICLNIVVVFGLLGFTGATAQSYDARINGREILTPEPEVAPKINGPILYGARSDKPFVYRIPTTGERPIKFSAKGLPRSLKLNERKGIVTGRTPKQKGEYVIIFEAKNKHGSDQSEWKLVVGDTLALTPTMGWNHWYTHYHLITDKKIRAAADAMVTSGMADVGYQYVSIDDCWMRITPENADASMDAKKRRELATAGMDLNVKVGKVRKDDGTIALAGDFPDMKSLTDHIHSYGLKAGIYTSPGPQTCQLFEGSWQHEAQDAKTFAEWGFDLLKYDWCRYQTIFAQLSEAEQTLDARKKPYQLMGKLLQEQDRDIVLNLCQYGRGDVWTWGKETGQSWRVGGDLGHTLTQGGIYTIAEKNIGIRKYNGPGGWNDPDYLIMGMWTSPFDKAGPLHPVELTLNEQYTYMSLWCLMASPLFFSGDMAQIDDFTRNILCNTEMIAVNQDSLGLCADPVRMDEEEWVLKKQMDDGSIVVGFFNLSKTKDRTIRATWDKLDVCCYQLGRDLWRQKNLGELSDELSVRVGPRGCAVIQLRSKY